MKQQIAALVSRWREWREREPTVVAFGIWDRLSSVEELGEPVYVSAFASALGYRLWKNHELMPNISPAQFVECAQRLLCEEKVQGAGYILDLTPDLKGVVSHRIPLLAAVAGGRRFQRRVEQLLH